MPITQAICCDEAGFTGPNLSDRDQPYFVYTALSLAPQIATDILSKVNRDFRLGGSEIKGNKGGFQDMGIARAEI